MVLGASWRGLVSGVRGGFGVPAAVMLFLGGCSGAGLPEKPNPLNNGITAKPYDGVTKTSYGPLINKPAVSCDPAMANAAGQMIQEGLRGVFSKIYEPVGGAMVYDDTLVKEELQDQFRMTGWYGAAYVKVLDRDENGIIFWYDLTGISDEELLKAATKFCTRRKKTIAFVGAARKCGEPINVPMNINGSVQNNQAIPTYAIAEFSCNPFTKPKTKTKTKT